MVAHNPLPSHTGSKPNGGTAGTELRSIYLDFLRRMCFDNSTIVGIPDNYDHVVEAVTALCGSYMTPAVVAVGVDFPLQVYKYYSLDHQVKIAHFVALAITIDDLGQRLTGAAKDVFLEDLALFQMKMCDPEGYAAANPGRGDLHRVLEDFIHYLRSEQNPLFPAHPRSLSILVKASVDFMLGNLMDQHYEDHPLKYTSEMRLFYDFFRGKTGFSEGFLAFLDLHTNGTYTSPTSTMDDRLFYYNHIYPLVPELIEGFNLMNDVLSFYKEMEDGETATNRILIRAKLKKMSLLDSLREVIDLVVEQWNRIKIMVDESGSLEWEKRIQQLYQGYIRWHVVGKRYRLEEVLGDFGVLAHTGLTLSSYE